MAQLPRPEKIFASYPHEISGGQKQRVMIAMAMACNPALLIADEPTTALDVTVQAQMLRLIDELRREHNTAVIFITHDLGVVAEIADRILVMYRGRVVSRAPCRHLHQPPAPLHEGPAGLPPKTFRGPQKTSRCADFMRKRPMGALLPLQLLRRKWFEAEISEGGPFLSQSGAETTKTFPVERSVSRPAEPHFGLESSPSAESGLELPLTNPASQGASPGLVSVEGERMRLPLATRRSRGRTSFPLRSPGFQP